MAAGVAVLSKFAGNGTGWRHRASALGPNCSFSKLQDRRRKRDTELVRE